MRYKVDENYGINRQEGISDNMRNVRNIEKPVEMSVRDYEIKAQRLRTVIGNNFGSLPNTIVLDVSCGIDILTQDLFQSGALSN